MNDTANLTFAQVTAVNVSRCDRWHKGGINDWTPERWMTATTGELGEAANALKKLFRIDDEIANISEADRQISTRQEAIDKIAEEVADTFIYLNLFACRLGIDLAAEVVKKFNTTSERYGFPERL
jgi:NTP pyrophosphatase (non-canonical NTP hydrolase)